MHTIYRLEHSNGKGPWYRNIARDINHRTRVYNRHNKLPPIFDDFPKWNKLYFCGVPNKKSLYKWYTKKELKELEERGIKLYKLKVKKVIPGTHQVFFLKRNIIEKHEIV